ncbi:MAG: phage terminase small subunit P27 family [Xanthobacter sp.]
MARGPRTDIPASTLTTVPKAPAWLPAAGKAEWRRVAPILVTERSTLSQADMPILGAYCAAFAEIQKATAIIEKEGSTFVGPSGPKKHPAVSIRAAAMTQLRQLGSELGLTPASRGRPAMREDGAAGGDIDLA